MGSTTGTGASDSDRLCRLFGVVDAYRDASGRTRRPPRDSVWAVLRALGAHLPPARAPSEPEIAEALRARRRELAERPLPPVVVAWDGRLPTLRLRVPEAWRGQPVSLRVELESGGERTLRVAGEGPVVGRTRTGGRPLVVRELRAVQDDASPLPPGLHGLRVTAGPRDGGGVEVARTRLVSAPSRVGLRRGGTAGTDREPGWALFLPLYALRDGATAGVGDYGALGRLGSWAADRGASRVATLPLLPLFLEEPFDPSPYAPVSRLFWSELYLDLEDAASRAHSGAARELLRSGAFGRRRAELESSSGVDYRSAAALRRELLAAVVAEGGGARALGDRIAPFGRFLRERRGVLDFAAFRAACERHHGSWRSWGTQARDAPLRDERLVAGRDFDPAVRDRHLVGQWLAEEQVREVAERGRRDGFGLNLDLPLSVHPDGYDVWRQRDLFAADVSVGAPPDAFYSEGQDWGFPPTLPHALRRSGYAYPRASLEHSLRRARALRIDHVVGLHRQFWIPRGAEPREGAYVRYPAREQYALLSLAALRHEADIVGEDLGTVPGPVRDAMRRHGVGRLFVVPFELDPDRDPALTEPAAGSVAMLDTHDTWPFAGWWAGDDIEGRVELGMLDPAAAGAERTRRARERRALAGWLAGRGHLEPHDDPEPADVLAACLEALGAGAAGTVVASLEDLWLERRPQNIPGAPGALRSWRRRAALPLEEVAGRADLTAALRRLDGARRREPHRPESRDEHGGTP